MLGDSTSKIKSRNHNNTALKMSDCIERQDIRRCSADNTLRLFKNILSVIIFYDIKALVTPNTNEENIDEC